MSRHYRCDYLQVARMLPNQPPWPFLPRHSELASRDQGRIGIWNHRDTALNRLTAAVENVSNATCCVRGLRRRGNLPDAFSCRCSTRPEAGTAAAIAGCLTV